MVVWWVECNANNSGDLKIITTIVVRSLVFDLFDTNSYYY